MEGVDHSNKMPLYIQLKQILLKEIAEGTLSNGSRFFSMRELAQRHKVSLITVSKAVSELVDSDVLYARQGKGIFVSNREKANGVSTDILTIGATFLDIYNVNNPYLTEVFKGITEATHNFNINLQIFTIPSVEMGFEENHLIWQNIRKRRISGLVIATRMLIADIVALQEEKIPFVWINNDLPIENLHSVLEDKMFSSTIIGEHLNLLGYKSIGLIVPNDDPVLIPLLKSFAIAKGLNFNSDFIKNGKGDEKVVAEKSVREMFSHSSKPESLIVVGVEAIIAALKALSKMNIKVGKDLGFIGIPSSSFPEISHQNNISTFEFPIKEIAEKSIEMLYKLVTNQPVDNPKILFPGKLIIRGSDGFPCKTKEEIVVASMEELKKIHREKRG